MFAKKNVKNIYALTPLQEGILFHALYDKDNATYFEQFNYHISGDLDVTLFESAWNELMKRHDSLRTMFVYKNVPQPLQIVLKIRKIEFLFKNLCPLSPESQREHWMTFRDNDRKRYFDLSKDVLMRLAVFQLNDKSFNITWSFHHIIMDGWCMGIVYDELMTIYQAMTNQTTPDLPKPVPFSDYVKWLKKQDADLAKNYWKTYLADYPALAGLPRIQSDKKNEFYKQTITFKLSKTVSDQLRQLAASLHVTLNIVFQVIWGILLGKYNATNDVVFASTVSGRPADLKGVERIIGLFINAIPVRIQMNPEQTVKDMIQKTHQDATDNKNFHYYSLADIQTETALKQHLLDHLLIFESYPDLGQANDDNSMFIIDDFEQFELTNYDLSIQVFPEETCHFCVIYNAWVYEKAIMEKIEPHLNTIILAILKDCNVKPAGIQVLSHDDQTVYDQAVMQRTMAYMDKQKGSLRSLSTAYAKPENDTQAQLMTIWKEIMAIEALGIEDNFFEWGGHSLMATRIVSRIHKHFNVEISLKTFFDHPNIKQLSTVIQEQATTLYADISAIPEQLDYELSHSQRRLWILDRIEENFIAYNQSVGFIFKGELNIALLKQAVHAVCQRHESLRTVFVTVNEHPRQKILPQPNVDISIIDLTALPHHDQKIKQQANILANQPFDLEHGPLIRLAILRLAEDHHVLLMAMHHIICDGWSVVLFEKEIIHLYEAYLNAIDITLPSLKIQYKDYAAWHNQLLTNATIKAHQTYWHTKLSGQIPVLDIPIDHPRPTVLTYNGHTVTHLLREDITDRLDQLCKTHEVSLFMVLLSAIKSLMHRYSGQEDIIIGSPIAGRIHPDLEDQIGFFVNTLALRDTIIGSETFMTLLKKIKQTTLEAYHHQVYPFDKLVEELDIQRDMSRSPIFDIMMVLQNTDDINANIANLDILPFDYDTSVSQFDITFIFTQEKETLRLDINYNTDLFEKETIYRMGGHVEELLKGIAADPLERISHLNLLTDQEKHQVLVEFNQTQTPYPKDMTLVDLFETQVNHTPNNIAVISENRQLTYKELNEVANQLAHYLRNKFAIQPDDLIGVIISRNEWLVIAMLAIMKAGGTYLPIDPTYPSKRIHFMLQDSACKAVLTENAAIITELNLPCLDIQSIVNDSQGQSNKANPKPIAGPDNLAYVIYTSGSTGQPKGVMIEHGGFVNMTLAQIKGFNVTESDRVLQFFSPSFDASLSEIFMALLKGAALVMIPIDTVNDAPAFLKYLESHQVSVITFPPVYLNMLSNHPLPTLKTIITAGEPAILSDVLFYCKDKLYFNAYGPTETSVCTSFYRVPPNFQPSHAGSRIPIGKPLINSSVYIVDQDMQPVPIGVIGEICFSGVGVARGYMNRPELTAEKFIPNPFEPGKRLYKIGDLGKWRNDGTIEFIGRKDDQVKVRGFRIELGEIESQLKTHPLIKDGLVLPIGNNDSKLLAAFCIPLDQKELDPYDIQSFLAQTLPMFMIPSQYIYLEKFPLTVNGKTDKRALERMAMDQKITQTVLDEKPRNRIESILVNVWQRLFQKQHISIHDNFFALGGDSIKAIQVISWLQQEKIFLKVRDIFQYPTCAQLANVVGSYPNSHIKQDSVTGNIPLTAIIAWFFNEFTIDKHYFNHSELFYMPQQVDPSALRAAFAKLQAHHDVLRMRCQYINGNWQIFNCDQDYPLVFDIIDLRHSENPIAKVEAHAATYQGSLDLEKGPLMKAVLFQLPPQKQYMPEQWLSQNQMANQFTADQDNQGTSMLLIIVHHLVIDAVSWRFFMDDLLQGYHQYLDKGIIALPLKTNSFQEWAEKIQAYSKSDALMTEKPYWQNIETVMLNDLPWDMTIPITEANDARMKHIIESQFSLSQSLTELFLTKVGQVYDAQPVDVLLTGLAYALKQWHGQDRTVINLEGHGREQIHVDMDISRTIGWFTAIYPIIIESPDTNDIQQQINVIKNQIRQVPNHGMGYGILKYITPQDLKQDMTFNIKPSISFNYLGQFHEDNKGFFKSSPASSGNAVSPNAKIIHDIEINALINDNKLFIYCMANRKKCSSTLVKKICDMLYDKLNEIIYSINRT